MERKLGSQINEQIDRWIDRQMKGWKDGQTDR